MSAAEADPIPTELVAGKYRPTRLLGRGGMGSVWEGVHVTLGTRVAVKFIEAEYADSPEARNRFENEARAAATLRSKHVVKVHDHGVLTDGRPYIVMEFLQGEPLDRRLERVGRLSPAETAKILTQVCRALAKAHSAGIVHRDLKPENVFLVWDDEDQADVVKVVDFGIAKFTHGSMGISSATRTGSVLGTPYYMSPEQARGLRSVDHRSDLWSVGVIAYRCVVGRLPFEGEAIGDLLVKLCTAPLPVPSQVAPDVPPGFDAWLARALCREQEGRFQSAAELADSLALACGVPASGARAGSLHGPSAEGIPPTAPGAPTPAVQMPSAGWGQTTPGRPVLAHAQSGETVAGQLPGSVTASPIVQTPPVIPKSKVPIVAIVATVFVVLGIGVAVAAKALWVPSTAAVDGDATASDPSAAVLAGGELPGQQGQNDAPPGDLATNGPSALDTKTEAPSVEPAPDADSASDEASANGSNQKESSQKAGTEKPVGAKPSSVKRPSTVSRPTPIARPRPQQPVSQPAVKPAPQPNKVEPKPIDVGY